MIKTILATLILSSLSASAMDSSEGKINATGVLAHTVLSQSELAKIKHLEINKVISVEKMKEKINTANNKIKKVNITSLDLLNKSNQPDNDQLQDSVAKKNLINLQSISKLLSEEELWGTDLILTLSEHQFRTLALKETELLSNTLKETREIRNKTEELISFYSFHVAINQEISETTRKENIENLLTAKESEIKDIMERKALGEGFEFNVYYLTNG